MPPLSHPPATRDVTAPAYGSASPDTIRVVREADIPQASIGATFQYSRRNAILVAGLMLGVGGALIVVGRIQGNPFAYYIAALLFGFLWIYQTMVLARFRPTNWLVRVGERGLYIKFRSYLNYHFPEGDRTVIYLPFRDLRLTRVVRELEAVPDTDGRGSSTRRRTVVELELKADASEIASALASERNAEAPKITRWYGSSAARYSHYPVGMPTPRVIAVEWGVVPRAADFLAVMAVHTRVEAAEITRDYTTLGVLARDEQESRLLELMEKGQVIDAIRLARSLYGYDLTEARSFVDGLTGRAKA